MKRVKKIEGQQPHTAGSAKKREKLVGIKIRGQPTTHAQWTVLQSASYAVNCTHVLSQFPVSAAAIAALTTDRVRSYHLLKTLFLR